MKILLDLQSAQLDNNFSKSIEDHPACRLAQALLAQCSGHQIHLLLNSAFPVAVEQLYGLFTPLLPAGHIHLLEVSVPESLWELQTGSHLYEALVNSLFPDVIHVTAPFAGSAEQLVVSPLFGNLSITTSIALDSLPPALYRPGANMRYLQAAMAVKRADLLLCLSAEAAHVLATQLHIPAERLVTVPPLSAKAFPALLFEQAATMLLQAWQTQQQETVGTKVTTLHRPAMAWLSPLPPEQSGIADYSAELLPELARYYDITLISDLPSISDPWLASLFPIQSVAWFEQHSNRFDRILYHIGNSHFHGRQFELLPRHPGTVVLHDIFLSNIVDALGRANGDSGALFRRAYHDHGYEPLCLSHSQGNTFLVDQYPCSLQVIRQSAGVLVHSAFARNLLTEKYGQTVAPLLHQVPFLRRPAIFPSRSQAREQLGIPFDAFVVCSFGFLGPTKLNHRLLAAWLGTSLAGNPRCLLLFVGGNHPGSYCDSLLAAISAAPNPSAIIITGFVEPQDYRRYLAAADLAVQLRENSRGETSAAIYDCLTAGLPLICNAHGSMAELPDDVAFKLPESFSDEELQQRLEQLHCQPCLGTEQAQNAASWLRQHHTPARVAACYYQAIEQAARTAPRNHERHLLESLPPGATAAQYANFAANLTANRQPCGLPQLLLDISAVARFDLKTGIERVVRSILNELLINPPHGYRVEPVYYNDFGGYSYARSFTLRSLGLDEQLLEETPVQAAPGDLFLGADLILAALPSVANCLHTWRMRGVQLSFIVYDLLPLQRPDCFPPDVEINYRNWLQTVSTVADHLVCISKAVADELEEHLSHNPPRRSRPLQIKHFHLGADIGSSLPTVGLLPDAAQILQTLSEEPTFLMVSTIEPRKGHTQALDAFELLWEQGIEANLAIVGKPGWMTEKLIERLDNHPQQGKRLFCLYAISDEMLEQVYKRSACLLAPSEGEGFGLPLIEAAQHGLPLIVRDIPVFREVAGNHATCFSGSAPQELAKAIRQWIQQPEHERTSSNGLPWLTWQQSVQQLLSGLGVKGEGKF